LTSGKPLSVLLLSFFSSFLVVVVVVVVVVLEVVVVVEDDVDGVEEGLDVVEDIFLYFRSRIVLNQTGLKDSKHDKGER
jgi:hypothetical protein